MASIPSGRGRLACTSACAATLYLAGVAPSADAAQVITPRTVPVQQSGQFDIFPSQRAGMAGVSIALDDTLHDPFVNPAKAVHVRTTALFTGLGMHNVSRGGGGGRTVPLGALFSRGVWAAGGLLAQQRLDRTATQPFAPSAHAATNHYLTGLLARRLGRGVALGASGYAASLDQLDGLERLYTGSDRLDMTGKLVDVRVGLLKDWTDGRSLEILVLHGRSDMSHDVRFPVQVWDPNSRTFTTITRDEHNDDRTRVWGAHTEMHVPIDRHGSRIGWLVTANRLSHPKIPNYPLANLPRDPGTTYAFNVGAGIANSLGRTAAGVDIVYEPIWSHTWADAPADVTTDAGAVIPAGGKVFENWFRFSNVKVNAGLGRELRSPVDSTVSVRIQLGLAVAANRYRLRQRDNVQRGERAQVTRWAEWGPTVGLAVRVRRVEIGYALGLNCSPGACAMFVADDVTVSAPPPGTGVIASPSGPVAFQYGRTLAHRFSVSLP